MRESISRVKEVDARVEAVGGASRVSESPDGHKPFAHLSSLYGE